VTTGCGHTFCSACLSQWLRAKESCPLCNAAVRRLPKLAVNRVLADLIAENKGPRLRARADERSARFYAALEEGAPADALAALAAGVDLERAVGECVGAAQERAPLRLCAR